jgi:outer membrane immunogenic protein
MGGGAVAADATWDSSAPYNWSGWAVSVFAGGVSGRQTGSAPTPNSGPSGADVGVSLGYSWQTPGNWVITPFVSVPFGGQTGDSSSFDVRVDWALLGGLKLGYAVDRWQPYGFVAGLVGGATASSGGSESHTHSGVVLGLGVDYALTDQWAIGARYAHVSVNEQDYFSIPVGWAGDSIAATLSFKLH